MRCASAASAAVRPGRPWPWTSALPESAETRDRAGGRSQAEHRVAEELERRCRPRRRSRPRAPATCGSARARAARGRGSGSRCAARAAPATAPATTRRRRHLLPMLGDHAQRLVGKIRRHGDTHFRQAVVEGNVEGAGASRRMESMPCVSSSPRTMLASISECVRNTTTNPYCTWNCRLQIADCRLGGTESAGAPVMACLRS